MHTKKRRKHTNTTTPIPIKMNPATGYWKRHTETYRQRCVFGEKILNSITSASDWNCARMEEWKRPKNIDATLVSYRNDCLCHYCLCLKRNHKQITNEKNKTYDRKRVMKSENECKRHNEYAWKRIQLRMTVVMNLLNMSTWAILCLSLLMVFWYIAYRICQENYGRKCNKNQLTNVSGQFIFRATDFVRTHFGLATVFVCAS